MPAWRGVLTDEQIWQATAYVLSLAAPRRKLACAARPLFARLPPLAFTSVGHQILDRDRSCLWTCRLPARANPIP